MSGLFTCPVCGGPLAQGEKVWRCPHGHSYDVAAEGYVYLLPPNKKHSKAPGDTKQMVAARRAFLEAGYYEPFRRRLCELACGALRGVAAPAVLDVGCGEGWYTGALLESLAGTGCTPSMAAFDISKAAVRAAAKRHKGISFAVASAFSVPVADASVDLAVNVFAPLVPEELRRVVRPGGFFLLAVPTARHLYGMKDILYDEPYENEYRETSYPGFVLESRGAVEGEITLTDPALIQSLFAMTPYYWKTPQEGVRRLAEAKSLRTEIGFDFLLYKREEATA